MARSGILGHNRSSLLTILKSFHTLFQRRSTRRHSHWKWKRLPFHRALTTLIFFNLFDICHVWQSKIISHYLFYLYFSDNKWEWTLFHAHYCPLKGSICSFPLSFVMSLGDFVVELSDSFILLWILVLYLIAGVKIFSPNQ